MDPDWECLLYNFAGATNFGLPVLKSDAHIRVFQYISGTTSQYAVLSSTNDTAANLIKSGANPNIRCFSWYTNLPTTMMTLFIPWKSGERLYVAAQALGDLLIYFTYD